MWGVWWEKNALTFDGCKRLVHDLKLLFFNALFQWVIASGVSSFVTLLVLLDICTFHSLLCSSCIPLAYMGSFSISFNKILPY